MLLSWLYEVTSAGIVRTEDVDPLQARSVQRATGRILDFIIIGVLLLVIAMLIVGRRPFYRQTGESISQKSIAVLPFDNRSGDKENAYFTDGVQDEILTDLAKIADLKVISRASVLQYKSGAARNLREIAQQLGVANVVEGSVQRSGNRVRVNAQLIDARNDAHLWAQTYDRDLADVFAIQSEIAKAIADQLQAKFSPNEKKAIEQPPTTDLGLSTDLQSSDGAYLGVLMAMVCSTTVSLPVSIDRFEPEGTVKNSSTVRFWRWPSITVYTSSPLCT
jgi:TolB-like protein